MKRRGVLRGGRPTLLAAAARLQPHALVVRRPARRRRRRRASSCSTPTASSRSAAAPLDSPLLTIDPVARQHLRAPGVQAAGQRPRARPGQAAADRQRPLPRAVPPAPEACSATAATLDDDDRWPSRTTCCCRTASRRRSTFFASVERRQGGDADAVRLLRRLPRLVHRRADKAARAIADAVRRPPGRPLAERVRRRSSTQLDEIEGKAGAGRRRGGPRPAAGQAGGDGAELRVHRRRRRRSTSTCQNLDERAR